MNNEGVVIVNELTSLLYSGAIVPAMDFFSAKYITGQHEASKSIIVDF